MLPFPRLAGLMAVGALGAALMPSALAGAQSSDWPTYHHDQLRTADAQLPGQITSLHASWRWSVPQGPAQENLYAEPLIAGGLVIVTSESNWVYAVDAQTGSLVWSRHVGRPEIPAAGVCGNVATSQQPTIGITSTPVIDTLRHELFVVAAIGTGAGRHHPVRHLIGLDLSSGAPLLDRVIEPGGSSNTYQLQRTALAETQGRIIVGYGGNAGDCGSYHGWLQSISASNPKGAIRSFEVDRQPGENMGAFWMGGAAPSIDAAGNVWAADGNGSACDPSSPYDFSDSVLRLSPKMELLDWFAPATLHPDNCSDKDLGSGAPQLLSSGLVLQVGKSHLGYILDRSALGHYPASVPTVSVCTGGQANGGDAVISELGLTSVLAIPCSGGLQGVSITKGSPSSGSLLWTSSEATAPPILAASSLVAIEPDDRNGSLVTIDPSTGALLLRRSLGPVHNHFATPAAGDGVLVVAGSRTVYGIVPTGAG